MKNILTALILALATGPVFGTVPYWQVISNPLEGNATGYLSGILKIYPSTATAAASPAIILDGVTPIFSVRSGADVSTITPTGFYGDGSNLTGVIHSTETAIGDEVTINKTGVTFSAMASSVTLQGNDYSIADIAASTGSNNVAISTIGVRVDELGVITSTQGIRIDALGIITSTQGVRIEAIAVSTGTLQDDLATEVSDRQIAVAAVAVSTGVNTDDIAALKVSSGATQAQLDLHTVATSTHGATAANTANRIVMRDGAGSFTAGVVTAGTVYAQLQGDSYGTHIGTLGGNDDILIEWDRNLDTTGALRFVAGTNPATHERARIEQNGNFGIGIAAPVYVLDVVGGGHFTSSITVDAGIYGDLTGAVTGNATTATTATNLALGAAGSLPYQSGAGSTAMLPIGANGAVLLSSASAPTYSSVLFENNSKIGIGVAAPNYVLHIVNGSDTRDIVRIDGADSTSEYIAFGVEAGVSNIVAGGVSADNSLAFYTSPSGVETSRMTISKDGDVAISADGFSVGGSTLVVKEGKVGIGKTPTNALTVLPGVAGDGIFLRESDDGNNAVGMYSYASSGSLIIFKGATAGMSFNGGSVSYINNGFNFGIGTASPAAENKLEVNGVIFSSSAIRTTTGFFGPLTGNADTATLAQAAVSLSNEPSACTVGQYVNDISSMGVLTCGTPSGSGDAVLAATQTFTGQNTFTNQVTISSNIVFASEFHNSSSTISMPTGMITQTTYNLCIATLTITTHGSSRIAVHASQSGTQDTAAKNLTPFYKIDGGTAVVGAMVSAPAVGYNFPFNLNMITGVLAEATYSICIGARVNGNTYTLANSADSGGWFWIEEKR